MWFSSLDNAVIDGMARAFFVCAWADQQEEKGELYPGQQLMDDAPSTPDYAREFALQYSGRLLQANGSSYSSLAPLLYLAAKADGINTDEDVMIDGEPSGFWEVSVNQWNNYAGEFGHYIAMQALGHGTSLFDDHKRFPLTVPSTEFYLPD